MAYQENNGWPLGLRTLNLRNGDFSGSFSFSTLFSSSHCPSSSISSSDYDSDLFGSVSYRRNRTLGSLIGITNELSNRLIVRSRNEESLSTKKSSYKIKDLFSLCLRSNIDFSPVEEAPYSLEQFLEMERRANGTQKKNPMIV
ncbi:hypothetical protein LUZ60_010921 [Juncus effusus]|nr:hypothetical protein LUZ60_010921 [Juncus effusus]